ncbi:MAG: hypothetical protein D6748_00840 [Calditrichaeota bacterium]|nr:MAG: hypothetical protein D6748_00840 [Calditrichota bacterium]
MKWLKSVIVDIGVTAYIIISGISQTLWMKYLLIGYTIIMLLLKLITYSNEVVVSRMPKTAAPIWFFHLLYAVNVVVLLIWHWWGIAAMWMGIWILSHLIHQKSLRKRTSPVKGKKSKKRR